MGRTGGLNARVDESCKERADDELGAMMRVSFEQTGKASRKSLAYLDDLDHGVALVYQILQSVLEKKE
jgi:hypothetical protein